MFDLSSLTETMTSAQTPDEAWQSLSGQLKAQGLHRTALHTRLPLSSRNPFGDERTGRVFGSVWDPAYDRRLTSYQGDIRHAKDPDLRHIRPTLKFLSFSRSPLFIDHREVVASRPETAFKPLCRLMIEHIGQYQAVAFPLRDPATGQAAILSAWGDEDRSDFSEYVKAHQQTLHLLGHYFMGMAGLKWPGFGAPPLTRDLSDRERQVLSLLAKGLTVAAVADVLRISDRSVTEYVLRSRQKLGVGSRTEAIARAAYLGLIE